MNIVMTGGTSGIGKIAAKRLIKEPGTKLILGCRNKVVRGAVHFPPDQARLGRVGNFAADVMKYIGSREIEVLICNSGVLFPDGGRRSVDGLEATFAVNHLAPYLLIRLLMPLFADNAKIILTTSGTHDPAEKTMTPPPSHANAFWLAHPEEDITRFGSDAVLGGGAYSSSKLCNILAARYIATLPEALSCNWQSIAFDPGPTPGTGLAQNSAMKLKALWFFAEIPFFRKRLFPKSSGRQRAGALLADIALGKAALPAGKIYTALRKGKLTFPEPSELAQSDEAMRALWKDSEELMILN